MNDFEKLTDLQKQKLFAQNICNLYDLITYFPYKLECVLPLEEVFKSSEKLFTGKAKLIKIGAGRANFAVLHFQQPNGLLVQVFYFGGQNVVYKSLKVGQNYFIKVQKTSKGFLNLLNFKPENKKNEGYKNLQPRYGKMGNLDTKFFSTVFQRLNDQDFYLNLTGLFPKNEILPNILNLKEIHLPSSAENFYKTVKKWQLFQSLLDLYFINYVSRREEKMGLKSDFDVENLPQITGKIPFDLSISQKKAIENIVTSFTN